MRHIKDLQLQKDFEKHLVKSESFRRIQALIGMVKMTKSIKLLSEDLDKNNYLINTRNCTIDFKTCFPRPAERIDLITKCAAVEYDKDAKCPTWNRFLLQIMNNDVEMIKFVQKAMGYALTGDVSEQCMFILWGSGANGKSTFLNTIQKILGDYACSTGTETFMKRSNEQSNDIARLRGMRLVTTSEVENGKALSESLIKQITGEDELTARFLYGEYFSFKPTFKIFMATNHKPKIKGGDYGIWRRIKLIPFNVTIKPEDRDKNLADKLEKEAKGIFNWMLDGYAMWKAEGLTEPDAIKEANEQYMEDMDTVGTFVKDCLEIDASGVRKISNKELYEAYIRWCNVNNERVGSQKYLAIRLQEKGFVRFVSNGTRYWRGMFLKMSWICGK